ncbi:hypothetical protein [Lentilactobacillus buchneri]|uniref:hypothetical protein n=1 Tax=Lentilactobacillus buchneri TaxID=1581 RepID=UPI0002075E04|nr:hypothetical protein [Lentilactobacillus buchneri]AEB74182.1 hypothetical protein Lbuc_1936 [Lentilactobacillus buchneri NRRL B-30929]MQM83380.1 hypothetical protein [Lentilactobacillus buchneri]
MKTIRHLFIITIAFFVFIAISTVMVRGDSLDEDTVPVNLTKKSLAKIEKSYSDVWNNVKYYRVNKTVRLKVKFIDRDTEKTTKVASIRVPKNTILAGSKDHVEETREKFINTFGLNYDTFSYRFLKPVLSSSMNLFTYDAFVNAKKMSSINKYFSRVKRPAYMPAYSSGSLYIYPTNKKKFSPFSPTTNRLKITSDGYLEFTKNNSPDVETNKSFNLTPDSHVKINKTILKNNSRYLYYAHHLAGVTDKQVAKAGKNMYRLTITNLHRPFSMFDGDQGAVLMSRYKVGDTVYYTSSGGYSA